MRIHAPNTPNIAVGAAARREARRPPAGADTGETVTDDRWRSNEPGWNAPQRAPGLGRDDISTWLIYSIPLLLLSCILAYYVLKFSATWNASVLVQLSVVSIPLLVLTFAAWQYRCSRRATTDRNQRQRYGANMWQEWDAPYRPNSRWNHANMLVAAVTTIMCVYMLVQATSHTTVRTEALFVPTAAAESTRPTTLTMATAAQSVRTLRQLAPAVNIAQERYRTQHGRYAGQLNELLPASPKLRTVLAATTKTSGTNPTLTLLRAGPDASGWMLHLRGASLLHASTMPPDEFWTSR